MHRKFCVKIRLIRKRIVVQLFKFEASFFDEQLQFDEFGAHVIYHKMCTNTFYYLKKIETKYFGQFNNQRITIEIIFLFLAVASPVWYTWIYPQNKHIIHKATLSTANVAYLSNIRIWFSNFVGLIYILLKHYHLIF